MILQSIYFCFFMSQINSSVLELFICHFMKEKDFEGNKERGIKDKDLALQFYTKPQFCIQRLLDGSGFIKKLSSKTNTRFRCGYVL